MHLDSPGSVIVLTRSHFHISLINVHIYFSEKVYCSSSDQFRVKNLYFQALIPCLIIRSIIFTLQSNAHNSILTLRAFLKLSLPPPPLSPWDYDSQDWFLSCKGFELFFILLASPSKYTHALQAIGHEHHMSFDLLILLPLSVQ